jgi:asparagine synthase (glutamine-hydrolysing)
MSAQFGRWNFDDMPPAPDYLEKMRKVLAPYGPDGSSSYSKGGVEILYYAFHTTKECRQETQPYALKSGAVITWDGWLDNRGEFIGLLRDCLSPDSADAAIVAAAYERWGTDCFARLVGDWALSIWNPNARSLILAKDPIGTRHLYYSADADRLTWSTVLDPLVLFAGKTFALEGEYIAGWLGMFPATHLTPYVGIHSVPPSCFVRLEQGRKTLTKYWDFDPTKKIRYRSDTEYEEHFRTVFAESVRRRLRSDAPVLAELSGGMDSSSIVCMADRLLTHGTAETPRLDTVSYYDDSEPNWNERPYFLKVEEQRGRAGRHINLGQSNIKFALESNCFAATPSSCSRPSEVSREFATLVTAQRNRVVLSGVGGDEVTGGLPTPIPELADLMARGRLQAFAHQLKIWALNKRKPWFHLLSESARGFFPRSLAGVPKYKRPASWLDSSFAKRHQAALTGYESRMRVFGPLPSFQDNQSTLDALRRQLGCAPFSTDPVYEKRYPYLDRDLLAFLFAVPREQLVRPGQRRSLMRRALGGIVPKEILNRKRKAFVARSPLTIISSELFSLMEMSEHMTSSVLGIVDAQRVRQALQTASSGIEVPIVTLMRTLNVETWLTMATNWGVLRRQPATKSFLRSQFAGGARAALPHKSSAS